MDATTPASSTSIPVRNKSPGRTFAVLIAFAALVALLLIAGYWPRLHAKQALQQESRSNALPKVVFIKVERAKATAGLILPASVRPQREATLYGRANGYVKRVHVDIGDHVTEEQLLAEIEAPEHDKELQQAAAQRAQIKTQLELARVTAERYRALLKTEAASPQEADEKFAALEARKSELAAAEANIRRLQQLHGYLHVTAPFAGTIVARNVDIGALVQAGSASNLGWLFKLVDSETLRIQVNVPQGQLPLLNAASEAQLMVPELGHDGFPVRVSRNAGVFDSATRTMLVELTMGNSEHKVAPGMYGQVQFHTKESSPPLVVPVSALIVTGDGLKLATLDAKDRVRMVPAKVGRDFGKELEILSGVKEGDRVINNPRDTLNDGDQVQALLQEKYEGKKAEEKKPADGDKAKAAAKS